MMLRLFVLCIAINASIAAFTIPLTASRKS